MGKLRQQGASKFDDSLIDALTWNCRGRYKTLGMVAREELVFKASAEAFILFGARGSSPCLVIKILVIVGDMNNLTLAPLVPTLY
jgi:hypothetical protein